MSNPEIIEKIPMSLSELKAELKVIQKRDSELSFRSGRVVDYINHVKPLSKTTSVELAEKLVGLQVPRLKEEHVVKIVDLLPVSVEELKVILQGYALTVSKELMSKIVDVVKEYSK